MGIAGAALYSLVLIAFRKLVPLALDTRRPRRWAWRLLCQGLR
jgi:hypothetical protein